MSKADLKMTLLTVAIVVLTTVANLGLNKFLGIDSPMLAFCFGITLCAYIGGFWQGVFATTLSLASILSIFAGQSILASQSMWAMRCVIFFLNGFFTSYVCGLLRDARLRLEESEAALRQQKSDEVTRAFEELRASRGFLDSIIENIPNMVFVKDAKTLRFVRFNRAGEEMLGRTREALLGKNDFDFFPEEQARNFAEADRKVLRGRAVVDIAEEPIQNAKGETLYLHTKKIPVFGVDGNPEFLLGISEDITEARKQTLQNIELVEAKAAKAEAERLSARMQELADAASDASRAKSAFMANISHEIRTPLGAMLGFAELALEDANLSPEHLQKLRTIERNGRQLLRIVNEILDLSKVESEHVQIENSVFNLFGLVEDVRELLTIAADDKSLRLKVDYHPKKEQRIFSDPNRIRQILINIVGNAVKFTEHGEVRMMVDLIPTEAKHARLEICVSDTGLGLSEEQAKRLFRPFAQADESMTRRFGGTGLGLFLSRKLANLMGGDVILDESKPHTGSTFRIRLDVELAEDAVAPAPSKTPDLSSQEALGSMKLLVVDDAPDNRALLQTYLGKWGIHAAAAANGKEGVAAALKEAFDVILLDIQMPEMDGFQAIRELRTHGYHKPIIALTAHAMKGDRERCIEAGFDDYLQKPIDRKALEAALRKFSAEAHT